VAGQLVATCHGATDLAGTVIFWGAAAGCRLAYASVSMVPIFVVEERYGFNTITLKTFVADKIKTYLVAAIIGGLLGSALIWLILMPWTWIWIWFTIVLAVFILLGGVF